MTHQAFSRARELEEMSAKLSHELKNPLGAIKTLVQLSGRDATGEKSRERLRVAQTEIERMNSILMEYLSLTRPFEKLRREPVDLGALTTREQGTGLRVALARAAFVQHGGGLQYTSAEGRGTTATGVLPLSGSTTTLPD